MSQAFMRLWFVPGRDTFHYSGGCGHLSETEQRDLATAHVPIDAVSTLTTCPDCEHMTEHPLRVRRKP